MRAYHDASAAGRDLPRSWVTIGNYDGLHLGHRLVLDRVLERAKKMGAPTLAVTFRPHPAAILSDAGAPERLTSDAQQRELLESIGLSGLLYQPFDVAFARVSAEDFYTTFLRGALDVAGIVVGSNFHFGARRRGDVEMLRGLARAEGEKGPDVVGVEPLVVGGEVLSSSRIRKLVAAGSVEEAASLLGRPFVLEGRVVHGDGRGRQIGFPTANVEPSGAMLPGPGVYVGVLRRDEQLLPAVVNVGRRPTFAGTTLLVEAHVLDWAGDLYGAPVRLAFLERLRDEKRFAGAEELVAQLREDVSTARAILASRPPTALAGIPGT